MELEPSSTRRIQAAWLLLKWLLDVSHTRPTSHASFKGACGHSRPGEILEGHKCQSDTLVQLLASFKELNGGGQLFHQVDV